MAMPPRGGLFTYSLHFFLSFSLQGAHVPSGKIFKKWAILSTVYSGQFVLNKQELLLLLMEGPLQTAKGFPERAVRGQGVCGACSQMALVSPIICVMWDRPLTAPSLCLICGTGVTCPSGRWETEQELESCRCRHFSVVSTNVTFDCC